MPQIMILEDEPLIAVMMRDWLREMGCEIVGPADTVRGALALLEDHMIDAAILDVSLKGENCLPVADALGQRGIPVAFATGDAAGLAKRHRDMPTLAKPFDFPALRDVVTRLLNSRQTVDQR